MYRGVGYSLAAALCRLLCAEPDRLLPPCPPPALPRRLLLPLLLCGPPCDEEERECDGPESLRRRRGLLITSPSASSSEALLPPLLPLCRRRWLLLPVEECGRRSVLRSRPPPAADPTPPPPPPRLLREEEEEEEPEERRRWLLLSNVGSGGRKDPPLLAAPTYISFPAAAAAFGVGGPPCWDGWTAPGPAGAAAVRAAGASADEAVLSMVDASQLLLRRFCSKKVSISRSNSSIDCSLPRRGVSGSVTTGAQFGSGSARTSGPREVVDGCCLVKEPLRRRPLEPLEAELRRRWAPALPALLARELAELPRRACCASKSEPSTQPPRLFPRPAAPGAVDSVLLLGPGAKLELVSEPLASLLLRRRCFSSADSTRSSTVNLRNSCSHKNCASSKCSGKRCTMSTNSCPSIAESTPSASNAATSVFESALRIRARLGVLTGGGPHSSRRSFRVLPAARASPAAAFWSCVRLSSVYFWMKLSTVP
jgi:hypothetical protein